MVVAPKAEFQDGVNPAKCHPAVLEWLRDQVNRKCGDFNVGGWPLARLQEAFVDGGMLKIRLNCSEKHIDAVRRSQLQLTIDITTGMELTAEDTDNLVGLS